MSVYLFMKWYKLDFSKKENKHRLFLSIYNKFRKDETTKTIPIVRNFVIIDKKQHKILAIIDISEEYAKAIPHNEFYEKQNVQYLMKTFIPTHKSDKPLLDAGLKIITKTKWDKLIQESSTLIFFKIGDKSEEVYFTSDIIDFYYEIAGKFYEKPIPLEKLEKLSPEELKTHKISIIDKYFTLKNSVEKLIEHGLINSIIQEYIEIDNKELDNTNTYEIFDALYYIMPKQMISLIIIPIFNQLINKYSLGFEKIFQIHKSEHLYIFFTRKQILELYNNILNTFPDINNLVDLQQKLVSKDSIIMKIFMANLINEDNLLEKMEQLNNAILQGKIERREKRLLQNTKIKIKDTTNEISFTDVFRYRRMTNTEKNYAQKYRLGLYNVYKYQRLSEDQINKAIEIEYYSRILVRFQKLTEDQIWWFLERRINLEYLYQYQKLTKDQIDKAIKFGFDLDILYQYQKLTEDQIDKAIDKIIYEGIGIGRGLLEIIRQYPLTRDQIDQIMEEVRSSAYMEDLYMSQLYIYQKLSEDQINKAIQIGVSLEYLCAYQKLSEDQITSIIQLKKYKPEYSEYLDKLYKFQVLTKTHINMALEKGTRLRYLYEQYNLSKTQIDRALENKADLDFLYRYQKLTNIQITKALEIKQHLNDLYRYQKLTKQQVNLALIFDVFLMDLYKYQTLNEDQVWIALLKKTPSYYELYNLYKYQKLTKTQVDKAINIGISLAILYKHQNLTPTQKKQILFHYPELENNEI